MNMKSLLAASGAAGLLFVAGGPGMAAYAYPPGAQMQLSVTPQGNDRKHHERYIATVTQAQPGCKVRFSADGDRETAVVGVDGTASASFSADSAHHGVIRVTAETSRCSSHEQASASIVISGRKIERDGEVKHGHSFRVQVRDWEPRSDIQFWATDGKRTIRYSGKTDRDGSAECSFTLPTKGRWAIVVAQNGHSESAQVDAT